MMDVTVPFLLIDQAPLQSQLLAQDFGSGLQPQLQLTAAPSPVAHASISQQPPVRSGKDAPKQLHKYRGETQYAETTRTTVPNAPE
jgi:hypothetical protein